MKKNAILLSLCLAMFTFTFAQEKTISKTFRDIKKVRLSTASGNIDLKKSATAEVKLTVKYTYNESDYKPVIEQSGSTLTLKEDFSRGNNSGNSSWSLELPDNISINMNTGSGDITIDQLVIDVKSNTGSGNVMLTTVKGTLDFNTGSGNIEIEQADGDISLNVGSGSIRASKSTGDFAFNAGSGNIRLDQVQGDFEINVGSGSIHAKALTLKGSSSFNSGSGNADVTLATALDYNISVNSGSGNAELNFNNNPISGEVVMTANKRNGNIVAPFKFDKEETIDDDNNSQRIRKTAKLGNKDILIRVSTGSGTAEISK
jgi:hypothetical protein